MKNLTQTISINNYQEVHVYGQALAHEIKTADEPPKAIGLAYAGQHETFKVMGESFKIGSDGVMTDHSLTLLVEGKKQKFETPDLLENLYTYMTNKYEGVVKNPYDQELIVEVGYEEPDNGLLEGIREAEKLGNDVQTFQVSYEGGSETLTVRMVTDRFYLLLNEKGREVTVLRSNLLGDLHDYVVDTHGVYGVEVEAVYEVNEADKQWVYELACEMAGEVLGVSPAYYGEEGDQEVIKQLKRLREAVNGVLEYMEESE